MKKTSFATISAALLVSAWASSAAAGDISTRKMMIKDNTDPAKRQLQLQSGDDGVQYTDAVAPNLEGASIAVYSDTDSICIVLPEGDEFWTTNGKQWKYKNKEAKAGAQIANGKLLIKLKTGVDFSLIDQAGQGAVNAQVQFGTGERFCMRCSEPKTDHAYLYLAGDCAATTCDTEPVLCDPTVTTTTSTTLPPLPGVELKAVLQRTPGRFNFNSQIGLAGAEQECDEVFPGTHLCSLADLQAAEAAGDLVGITDPVSGNPVTSFWLVDAGRPAANQCAQLVSESPRWVYSTGHLNVFGDFATVNNATGDLGAQDSELHCNTQRNLGCCAD